ncbi:MAG TPA: hypothetical protein VL651_05690 [Bacteroidia bacterium]|nr:hypothetical protein [Bacteroidia bacterium]
MKNLALLSLFTLTFTFTLRGQTDTVMADLNPKYVAAMKKQLVIMDTASTQATYQGCFNAFERVAGAEPTQWLPWYYQALSLIMESYFVDTKQVDAFCDQADACLVKADSISPNNSEIYVLRSISTSARIRVSPMSRGAKFGKESGVLLQKAQDLDSTNPRVYFTKAQGLYYTPPAFGGGKDKAKVQAQKALTEYDIFKPKNSLCPNWGRKQAQKLLDDCSK